MDESARWDGGVLDETQAQFVLQHLIDPKIVNDMSWGLVDTKVLHVRDGGRDVVVKAAGPAGHHIGREITAHESDTGPLVEGTPYQFSPDVHAQAGLMLRALHGQARRLHDESLTLIVRARSKPSQLTVIGSPGTG